MSLPLLADPLPIGPLDAGVPYTYVIAAQNADSYSFDVIDGWDIAIAGNVVTLAWHPRENLGFYGSVGGSSAWLDPRSYTLRVYATNPSGSVNQDVLLTTRAILNGIGAQFITANGIWWDHIGNGYAVGDRIFVENTSGVTLLTVTAKRTISGSTPFDEYQFDQVPADFGDGIYKTLASQSGRTMGNIPTSSPAHAAATRGVDFTYLLTDDGFSGASRAIGVPDGLGLDQTIPQLEGRPIEWGWFPVILRNGGFQRYLVLEVAPGAYDSIITSSSTSAAIAGRPWTFQAKAPSLSGTVVWTVNGAPITINNYYNNITGLFAGTFDRPGVFEFEVIADNGLDRVTKNLTVTVSPDVPAIDTAFDGVNSSTFTYGNNEAIQIPFSASNSPTNWSAPTLPPGLALDAATGILSGYVGVAGLYSFTLTASNATGGSVPVVFKLRITAAENAINKAPFLPWLHSDPSIIDLQALIRPPRTVSSFYMAEGNTLAASLGDDLRLAVLLIDPTQSEPYLAGATSVRFGMRRKDEYDDSFFWFSQNFSVQTTAGHTWYLFEGKLEGATIRNWLDDLNDPQAPESASASLAAMCQIRWISPAGIECRSAQFGFTILQSSLAHTGPLPEPVSGCRLPAARAALDTRHAGRAGFRRQ